MEAILVYRGRPITTGDIEFIRDLIDSNPADHRTALSRKICQLWNWTQPNGYLKDAVCRGLLLRLEREGYIKLPPRQSAAGGPHSATCKPVTVDQTPICNDIPSLAPISIHQVRRTPLEGLHDALLAQFHYLRYTRPVGEQLKYLAFAHRRPLACLTWASAPRHIRCRDRYIGWDLQTQRRNIHLLAYNTRFLVLPWVSSHCLASHVLSATTRTLCRDWQDVYAHPAGQSQEHRTKIGKPLPEANPAFGGETGSLSESRFVLLLDGLTVGDAHPTDAPSTEMEPPVGWALPTIKAAIAAIALAHPVYWLETFVDTNLFKGTCYKASNWIYLGNTTGRGKDDLTHRPNRSIKAVWGYPLCRDFRHRLCHG